MDQTADKVDCVADQLYGAALYYEKEAEVDLSSMGKKKIARLYSQNLAAWSGRIERFSTAFIC